MQYLLLYIIKYYSLTIYLNNNGRTRNKRNKRSKR